MLEKLGKREKKANSIKGSKISEEKLRELYDKMPANYQSLDKDGNILHVNKAWLKTLGYSEQEVIGKWFGYFLTPEYIKTFKTLFPLFVTKKVVHDANFDILRKDGTNIHVSYEGQTSEDEKGNFKYSHCVFKDISKHVNTKENLEKRNLLLSHFDKLAINRELKMRELKEQIIKLKEKLAKK